MLKSCSHLSRVCCMQNRSGLCYNTSRDWRPCQRLMSLLSNRHKLPHRWVFFNSINIRSEIPSFWKFQRENWVGSYLHARISLLATFYDTARFIQRLYYIAIGAHNTKKQTSNYVSQMCILWDMCIWCMWVRHARHDYLQNHRYFYTIKT